MFRRKWLLVGPIVSDEGFEVTSDHRTAYYRDSRGTFSFGYEDGYLIPTPYHIESKTFVSKPEADEMADRVVRSLEFRGDRVYVVDT